MLELKKQENQQELNKEWLEDRRLELSGLLGQFLKQEKEREFMAKGLLVKMEEQKEQDQAMFWLVQFQVSFLFLFLLVLRLEYYLSGCYKKNRWPYESTKVC